MANTIKDMLLQAGLKEPEYNLAIEKSEQEKISLMHAIEQLNALPEATILDAFAKFYRIPKANIGEMEISDQIINLIPKDLALKLRVIPLDRAGNNIIVAMGDPKNLSTIDAIRFSAGFFAKPVLASELRITEALDKYYGRKLDVSALAREENQKLAKKNVQDRISITEKSDKSDGPIIQLVNTMIWQCIQRRASDIHIEPYESYARIRLRIDGVLHEIARPPLNMKAALISRVKIMANLDIAETRLPQDGAINVNVGGKPVDFRVSTIPASFGEKIVMRVLDKSALKVDMTQLGFDEDELKKFAESIHAPQGIVLVTGPTGSGKTTTLYSALGELNEEGSNIMTAEDPVEYNIEGINQIQVKPDIGLSFASALRSFLRQDPDIVMVGEIRDKETAEIAVQAALTGHLVLSTVHTNSAPETLARLMHMGVESFNLVSALTCITAQRLVRKICTRCRTVDESVTPEVMIKLGIPSQYAQKVKAYKGTGCPVCLRTGMHGRQAVHEILRLNDPIREAILRGASAMELKKIAMQNGMRTLRQSALTKMIQGVTSAQEVVKVTASDDINEEKSTAGRSTNHTSSGVQPSNDNQNNNGTKGGQTAA